MKVKSKTDVITNSSTEIYTYWDSDAPKTISNYLGEIIKTLTGQDVDVSECLDITMTPSWWLSNEYRKFYEGGKLDKTKYSDKPEYEDYCNFVDEFSEHIEKSTAYDECYPPYELWDGVSIVPKKPKYKDAAIKLNTLVNGELYEQDASFG